MSCDNLTLHVDRRPEMALRSRLFGHPGVIIPFSEGFIAKRRVLDAEYSFYRSYTKYLPTDLVPEVAGICDDVCTKSDTIRLKLTRQLPEKKQEPVLILKDLASGYKKPCVLDIKLGIRTWALGAAADKVERHRSKCGRATTGSLRFRVRAALWKSRNPENWPSEDGISYVTRDFGNSCNKHELEGFLADFLHHESLVGVVTKRLTDIKRALVQLRLEADARMFSSSILIAYDETDPTKVECRLLDFGKTYFDIKRKAELFHESIEDCEDGVIPALTNLIEMLKEIKHHTVSGNTNNST